MRRTISQILFIILAIMVPVIPFLLIGEIPGDTWLSAYDDDAFLFSIAGTLLMASDILLPVPSSILGTLLGARLGFVSGFIAAFCGLAVGQILGYFVGYLIFSRFKNNLSQKPTLLVLFLSRPVPVLAEAMSLAAGGSRINFGKYVVACGLGNAIYAAVISANGASLIPDSLVGPGLIVPMLVPASAWLIWKYIENRKESIDIPE